MMQKLRVFAEKYGHYFLYGIAAICLFSAIMASVNGVKTYSYYHQGRGGSSGVRELPYEINYFIAVFLIWWGYRSRPK